MPSRLPPQCLGRSVASLALRSSVVSRVRLRPLVRAGLRSVRGRRRATAGWRTAPSALWRRGWDVVALVRAPRLWCACPEEAVGRQGQRIQKVSEGKVAGHLGRLRGSRRSEFNEFGRQRHLHLPMLRSRTWRFGTDRTCRRAGRALVASASDMGGARRGICDLRFGLALYASRGACAEVTVRGEGGRRSAIPCRRHGEAGWQSPRAAAETEDLAIGVEEALGMTADLWNPSSMGVGMPASCLGRASRGPRASSRGRGEGYPTTDADSPAPCGPKKSVRRLPQSAGPPVRQAVGSHGPEEELAVAPKLEPRAAMQFSIWPRIAPNGRGAGTDTRMVRVHRRAPALLRSRAS